MSMNIIGGFLLIGICVFGAFVWAGGNVAIVTTSAPYELLTVIGASVGAFIVGNSPKVLRRVTTGIGRVFRGERWNDQDYQDLLCLLFVLVKTIRTKGIVAVEAHIERPLDSSLFQQFPRLLADRHLTAFICDYVRMLSMNFEDPFQVSEAMEQDLETRIAEEQAAQFALQTMADGLPAIGIIAAVMGVIKTMGAIDQPTEVLGAMIGGALVGTFLGVLLGYCFVGPIASRLGQLIESESKLLRLVKNVFVAHLQGLPPQVAVEIGRRNLPSDVSPGFDRLEDAINALPTGIV
jgi:chemotaxis protein MotA